MKRKDRFKNCNTAHLEDMKSRLINLYKQYRKVGPVGYCAVCEDMSCGQCAWYVISGIHCVTGMREHGYIEDIRLKVFKKKESWRKYRMPQIKRWIKMVDREIERRG